MSRANVLLLLSLERLLPKLIEAETDPRAIEALDHAAQSLELAREARALKGDARRREEERFLEIAQRDLQVARAMSVPRKEAR